MMLFKQFKKFDFKNYIINSAWNNKIHIIFCYSLYSNKHMEGILHAASVKRNPIIVKIALRNIKFNNIVQYNILKDCNFIVNNTKISLHIKYNYFICNPKLTSKYINDYISKY